MASRSAAETFTITFGDMAESHVGMQMLGELVPEGLTVAELETAQALFAARGITAELIRLPCPVEAEEAAVLLVRGGVDALLSEEQRLELTAQLRGLRWDAKALMRGRVVNKHMRHNLCFAPASQVANFAEGQGTVVAWSEVPLLSVLRQQLHAFFGDKAANLVGEGNRYYDVTRTGIGYHGDGERKVVIAARMGQPFSLHYQWFQDSVPVGPRHEIALQDGDIYAMSEKATGFDWKLRKKPTLRHAAGAFEFLLTKMPSQKRPLHARRDVVHHG